jgi:hypothetical protein
MTSTDRITGVAVRGLEFVGHVGASVNDRALREVRQRLGELAALAARSPNRAPVVMSPTSGG